MKQDVRIGLIGTGFMGKSHAMAYHAVPFIFPSAARPVRTSCFIAFTKGSGTPGSGGAVKTRPIPDTVAKCQSANHRKNRIAIYCVNRMRILVGRAGADLFGRTDRRIDPGDGPLGQ